MGVKSLWSLLEPVGRPVPLETIEGKALAIDSSIWIYQFQATMRDKEGRALVNAHVLAFSVASASSCSTASVQWFVFDGGAPALKRNTIVRGSACPRRVFSDDDVLIRSSARRRRSGAAASHAKIAERLLAAQMRREALVHAQASKPPPSKGKQKVPSGPVVLDEDTVYLEDITGSAVQDAEKEERSASVDMEEQVAKATRTHAPDPRLATEEELRAFIEEMRPEDFDVTSPAFRELPTERLQNMLRKTTTPLDFSREQIKNLQQRNALTQQLLMTTDSIGKAHITIPVRIASERNREYLLIKNEGVDGGWVLGIRDEGTRAKPIEIDQDTRFP
ncbi:XPG N-terminal domain-containing protein [Boletus edulis BED1]|uniref:XPG N-terminal domain-containing protein n=1 Tax=Boletus edulis BED1 TaxID=1328754 RepID=A0AAD4BCF2_BOLED|nr:XPG N-terminal domain-containing protein [Boletus edulis BED1]